MCQATALTASLFKAILQSAFLFTRLSGHTGPLYRQALFKIALCRRLEYLTCWLALSVAVHVCCYQATPLLSTQGIYSGSYLTCPVCGCLYAASGYTSHGTLFKATSEALPAMAADGQLWSSGVVSGDLQPALAWLAGLLEKMSGQLDRDCFRQAWGAAAAAINR